MGEFNLNLSTRPFPAYRALNMALMGILAVLAVVSAWQAYSYLDYSGRLSKVRGTVLQAEAESKAAVARAKDLEAKLGRPEVAAKLKEIGYLNKLIARKTFKWTRVFSDLETLVPASVHLRSMRPEVAEKGQIWLHFEVQAKSVDDVSDFVAALEKSPIFENVDVAIEDSEKVEGGTAPVNQNSASTANSARGGNRATPGERGSRGAILRNDPPPPRAENTEKRYAMKVIYIPEKETP